MNNPFHQNLGFKINDYSYKVPTRDLLFHFYYRVSHETWQLVNNFECRLPYTVLKAVKALCRSFSLKNLLLKYILYFEINFTITKLLLNIFIIVFGIKELNKLWKKIKLFTNCHVSWDTRYIWHKKLYRKFIYDIIINNNFKTFISSNKKMLQNLNIWYYICNI